MKTANFYKFLIFLNLKKTWKFAFKDKFSFM